MSTLLVDVEFHADVQDPDAFDTFLDAVMDELTNIGREADLAAALVDYRASFAIQTPDQSTDAVIAALVDLRAALHAADCGTAGWPDAHEIIGTRQAELADA